MLTSPPLETRKYGDAIVVDFTDHPILDEFTVREITEPLYDVADRDDCRHLILDLSSVVGLSSLLLGKLLTLRREMEVKGGKLLVCAPSPEVREVFAKTRLDQILEIVDSQPEALEALAR